MYVIINGPGDPPSDLLTLKLVCESRLRLGTFLPNLGTLGFLRSRIIRYVRDRRTDIRTDKSNGHCSFNMGRGIITQIEFIIKIHYKDILIVNV